MTRRGSLLCWGLNTNGQFGNGGFASKPYPDPAAPTVGIDSAALISCAPNGVRTCAISRSGSLYCWGGTLPGGGDWKTAISVSPGPRLSSLSVLGIRVCAAADDEVTCWVDTMIDRYRQVTTTNIAAVALTSNYLCTLTTAGVVGCSESYSAVPMLEHVTDGKAIAGGDGVCVLRSSGAVWCFGGSRATVGYDPTGPAGPVPGVAGATSLSGGSFHYCAVVARGQVVCWGSPYTDVVFGGPIQPAVAIPGTGPAF